MDWMLAAAVVGLPVLLGAAGAVAGVAASKSLRRRQNADWRGAADQLGLAFEGSGKERLIHGRLNAVWVRIEHRSGVTAAARSSGEPERTILSAGGDIPQSLALRADDRVRALTRGLSGGKDEQIGDLEFDRLVELPRLDAYGCAALSRAAREDLEQLMLLDGELREGVVICELGHVDHDRRWLVAMLRLLARLGQALAVTPESLHARLSDNALRDPNPGVRLRNLQFLAEPGTRAPAALIAESCRALLADDSPSLRLLAAQQLGPEGLPALKALAGDARVEPELRARALGTLDEAAVPDLAEILAPLLSEDEPELVRAVLGLVARRRLGALSGRVLECARSRHTGVRAAAASTLGQLPQDGLERQLIALLGDESSEVQAAAAEALGHSGSVTAVEPLLELARGFGKAQLRQAARGAIGRIQSRLGNVEAGALSLAEGDELAGALELAETSSEDRAGEISLAEEQEPPAQGGSRERKSS